MSIKTESHILNNRIRDKELRVIDDEGGNLGVISTTEALKAAQAKNLDLLLVSPNAKPPVARIVDYSKYLYEERKKKNSAKVKSKKSELKEFRFGPTTGEGDLNRFIDRSKEFIKDGNRVKITVRMQGREQKFPEVALDKIKFIEKELLEVAKIEVPAKRNGPLVWIIFSAK